LGEGENDEAERNSFYSARAFAYHNGVMKKAVHRLKYKNDLGLGKVLAKKIIKTVEDNNWIIDIIVPIPLGKKRRKDRGYNQAELIAFPLSHYLRINYGPNIIRRCKETRTQIGLTVKERFENVNGAFEVMDESAKGKAVLLIDEVYTSGATMRSAAQALKDAGARRVYSLTVTRANDFSAQEIW
jgi:ComF family protein